MHSVMPGMLRKATEPPVCYAKDYSVNVPKRVEKVIHDYKKWRQENPLDRLPNMSDTEESSDEEQKEKDKASSNGAKSRFSTGLART